MQDWNEELKQLDSLIKGGEGSKAREIINGFELKKLTRPHRAELASLMRRSGLVNESLKLLNQIVRTDKLEFDPPSGNEKLEYATSLIRLGAVNEARDLINQIDANEVPKAELIKAFSYFNSWDYAKAIPLLESFTSKGFPDYYQVVIGLVNLLDCYIYVGSKKAGPLMRELLSITKKNKFYLLYGAVLDFCAQYYLSKEKLPKAHEALDKSKGYLERTGSPIAYYNKKWQCILQVLQSKDTSPLWPLIEEAKSRHDWGTLRQCDLYLSKFTDDPHRLNYLYYGSPYESYKKNVLDFTKKSQQLEDEYFWIPESYEAKDVDFFDMDSGCDHQGSQILKPGQASHRLLNILSKDFYGSWGIPVLHDRLFDGDYYNPNTGHERVEQAINRLRRQLSKSNIPLSIERKNGRYRITGHGDYSIKLHREKVPNIKDQFNSQLGFLRSLYGVEKYFTTKQVADDLNTSLSSSKRFIKKGVNNRLVRVEQKGPNAKYRFTHFMPQT